MFSFRWWRNNKNHAFPSKRCISNDKNVLLLQILQRKSYVHTCTWTVIRKFYLLKSILAYCGYSPTSPFFLLVSEHKHWDNAATNSNSENARSRMMTSLQGSVGTGTKEDESGTGRVWAAGFHHVNRPFSLGAHFGTYEQFISLIFQIVLWTAVNRGYWIRGYGGPPVLILSGGPTLPVLLHPENKDTAVPVQSGEKLSSLHVAASQTIQVFRK